ncbi:zinc-binding dehydrogenase [Domibacillus sp. A3M-37]|nr:zinc-binding dehydrogenase [Domibacillus sp. A3M-37]
MMIGHTYKLADAAEAHALMEARKSKGKILLIPPHSELTNRLKI